MKKRIILVSALISAYFISGCKESTNSRNDIEKLFDGSSNSPKNLSYIPARMCDNGLISESYAFRVGYAEKKDTDINYIIWQRISKPYPLVLARSFCEKSNNLDDGTGRKTYVPMASSSDYHLMERVDSQFVLVDQLFQNAPIANLSQCKKHNIDGKELIPIAMVVTEYASSLDDMCYQSFAIPTLGEHDALCATEYIYEDGNINEHTFSMMFEQCAHGGGSYSLPVELEAHHFYKEELKFSQAEESLFVTFIEAKNKRE